MSSEQDRVLASRIPVSEPSAFGELGRIAASEASRRGVGQALSAAEFDAGIKLAQRITNLEIEKAKTQRLLGSFGSTGSSRLQNRIANADLYIKEANQALDSIMAVANENERTLLKQALRALQWHPL